MLFQSSISGVTAAYNREQLWLANEGLITKLQACCRGYLVRQEFRSRMNFLKKQIPAITCIQVLPTASGPLEQEE
jgi:Ras GTPase-activating-like protein IQGAP1